MTLQINETLIIEGKQFSMTRSPSIQTLEGQIIKSTEPKPTDGLAWSTACWRNYVGTWEIRNGKIFLVDVYGMYRKLDPNPIFADWFSGPIVVQDGDPLYVELMFDRVFERERHISITAGHVDDYWIVNNCEIRFGAFNQLSEIWRNVEEEFAKKEPSLKVRVKFWLSKRQDPDVDCKKNLLVERCHKEVSTNHPQLMTQLKGICWHNAIESVIDGSYEKFIDPSQNTRELHMQDWGDSIPF